MTGSPVSDSVLVIMAGGAGERFWPVSSPTIPKQLLRIYDGRTLLEIAFLRACELVPADRVFIVAGPHLRDAITAAIPGLPLKNYIEEPMPRNTAACLGLAASLLDVRFGSHTVMGVLTADHLIDDHVIFANTVGTAMAHAAASSDLVTIGMKPTRPETAFGYLELAEKISDSAASGEAIYRIDRFIEKPPLETAKQFLNAGNFLWNSGMFFWKLETLFDAFAAFQPEMSKLWQQLREQRLSEASGQDLANSFAALPSLPIDTAIMEHSDKVVAVLGYFRWEDVGSWDALERASDGDDKGNHLFGRSIAIDSSNNIAYNDENGDGREALVLFGVENLVVARSGRAILVMPKSRSQDLKALLKKLREEGHKDLTD